MNNLTLEQRSELESLDITSIMALEGGRRLMWDCLTECRTFTAVAIGDTDAYHDGRRSIGVWLDSKLRTAAPESYITMLKENDHV